jgi:hypothetical protein
VAVGGHFEESQGVPRGFRARRRGYGDARRGCAPGTVRMSGGVGRAVETAATALAGSAPRDTEVPYARPGWGAYSAATTADGAELLGAGPRRHHRASTHPVSAPVAPPAGAKSPWYGMGPI